jgi:hypothetical protein
LTPDCGARLPLDSPTCSAYHEFCIDEIDILEALLYLPPQEALQRRNRNDIERLNVLSKSSDTWIRDGATAALAEFDTHSDQPVRN